MKLWREMQEEESQGMMEILDKFFNHRGLLVKKYGTDILIWFPGALASKHEHIK